jgi:hypothetical protein
MGGRVLEASWKYSLVLKLKLNIQLRQFQIRDIQDRTRVSCRRAVGKSRFSSSSLKGVPSLRHQFSESIGGQTSILIYFAPRDHSRPIR